MAQPPHHPPPTDALTDVPKESWHGPPTPPPAYYPSTLHLRQQQMMRRVTTNPPYPVSEADFARLRAQHASAMNRLQDEDEDVDMDDGDDGRSPIDLRVSTALHIQGDNNAVLVGATPVDHARAVAHAVISAIRQCSDVTGGIPMIDEEGRPRPFNIAVDAGVSVEGSGNLLGNEEHIKRFLGGGGGVGGGSGGGGGGGGKRKRDDGDGREGRDGHRRWRLTRRSSV